MFFSTTSYRLSTRLPHFAGTSKDHEPTPEQGAAPSTNPPVIADSFQSQKLVPSIMQTATSTLTHLLKGRSSKASPDESSMVTNTTPKRAHNSTEQQMLPVILEQLETENTADAQSGLTGEDRTTPKERPSHLRLTVPPHTRRPLHTPKPDAPKNQAKPTLKAYGNLEQALAEAMKDSTQTAAPESPSLQPIYGEQRPIQVPPSPLPIHVPHWSTTATSLAIDSAPHSRMPSTRASSRRHSTSQAPEPSDLESSQFSDTTSAWLAGQDDDVQEEREAWKLQKNTRAASSYAASSNFEDEEELSDHSLEGDSQLDEEDYALYRDELRNDESSDLDDAASISKKSAPRTIPKRKDPFAAFFRSKSPKEIQEVASLPHPSMLSQGLMSPETRKIHDLISSYRQKVEQDYASLNKAAMQQKQQEEIGENIRLCSKYSLEELKQRRITLANHLGYNQYRANKWLNGLRATDWMTKVGIPPEAFRPDTMEARLAELNEKNVELTGQLERLPHPGLGRRSRSVSSVMRERDVIQQERDKISDYVSEIESNMHTYEAFQMRLERINIQLHQNNQAILMKRKAIILNQLNDLPEAQDDRTKLWKNLADNYSREELEQVKALLTNPEELEHYKKLLSKKLSSNVHQVEILRKAKDFQQTRQDDLVNLLKKVSSAKGAQEELEQRLAQDFTYRELMRLGHELTNQNDPGNDPQMTILKNALKHQATRQ